MRSRARKGWVSMLDCLSPEGATHAAIADQQQYSFVYSTRERQRTISPQIQPKLWAYVAGIVKNIGGNPIAIGGMDDHIHILAEMPATIDIAKAVNAFKVNSSQWMKKSAPKFAWQRGYAAFSVSASNVPAVKKYVLTQPEHHKKRDFKAEFIALLKKHGVKYDERYVFD